MGPLERLRGVARAWCTLCMCVVGVAGGRAAPRDDFEGVPRWASWSRCVAWCACLCMLGFASRSSRACACWASLGRNVRYFWRILCVCMVGFAAGVSHHAATSRAFLGGPFGVVAWCGAATLHVCECVFGPSCRPCVRTGCLGRPARGRARRAFCGAAAAAARGATFFQATSDALA